MFESHLLLKAALTSLSLLATASVNAAQSVVLPTWVCAHPDALFIGGFEPGERLVSRDPSHGTGGAYSGSMTRSVHIANLGSGTQTYYLYVPTSYAANRSWPLLLALDGVAPYASAGNYAADVRDAWSSIANAGQFIVAAPVGNDVVTVNGQNGISWLVPPTFGPNDYDQFAAIRADIENAYNIDRTRIYGWGFSAGGNVMHDLGVNAYSTAFNASTLAAYAVVGADLAGLACAGWSDAQCNQALVALPRKIPVDIHIGNTDPNYPNAVADHNRFAAAGWVDGQSLFFTSFVGNHTYTMTAMQQAWTNLCPNAVTP